MPSGCSCLAAGWRYWEELKQVAFGDTATDLHIKFFFGVSTTGVDLLEKWKCSEEFRKKEEKVKEIDSKPDEVSTKHSVDRMSRENFKNSHSDSIDFSTCAMN